MNQLQIPLLLNSLNAKARNSIERYFFTVAGQTYKIAFENGIDGTGNLHVALLRMWQKEDDGDIVGWSTFAQIQVEDDDTAVTLRKKINRQLISRALS